jgi:eukaryotic-like serine/threonine-protein kinase
MENILIDGRYLLLAVIGTGGEARVYRARDQRTGTDVALRLPRESRLQTAPIDPPGQHEHWVQLLASGSDPVRGAYNVFELLEGRTLAQVIETGPLQPADWRTFVDQSLAAVNMLHTLDWIHGDINADNFFQTGAGWKLLELPFLRLPPPPGRSAMFGSIFTLAPEQIYALGCLYYYAACGRYPFMGNSTVEIALDIRVGGAPGLRGKAPALPEAWCDWVMKMISPQLKDRFSSLAAARQLLGVA